MLKYVDLKKEIKFEIRKKIWRRGKVYKPINLSLSKENIHYDINLSSIALRYNGYFC